MEEFLRQIKTLEPFVAVDKPKTEAKKGRKYFR